MLAVKWCGHLLWGLYFFSDHSSITTCCHSQARFSCLLTYIFCLISLCCEICGDFLHLPSFYKPSRISPCQVSLLPLHCISVMECALAVAFSFPSLSLPLSMGTLGLRQSCVAMAAGSVAELRTPGIWSLSLLIVSLPPIFSTFLSGFLWCSRGYQHPSLSFPSLTPHSLSPSKALSHT